MGAEWRHYTEDKQCGEAIDPKIHQLTWPFFEIHISEVFHDRSFCRPIKGGRLMLEVVCDFLPTYVYYMSVFLLFKLAPHRTFVCVTLQLQRPLISVTFHIFKSNLPLLSMSPFQRQTTTIISGCSNGFGFRDTRWQLLLSPNFKFTTKKELFKICRQMSLKCYTFYNANI